VAETETESVELLTCPAGSVPAPATAQPRAPSRASGDLETLSSQAGQVLVQAGVPYQAATDLNWARLNLGAAAMGRTIVQRLGTGQMDAELGAIFRQPWDILEVAAMSLGFEDVMTALDLCADAVLLTCGQPRHRDRNFYDLGQLRKRRPQLAGPPVLGAWVTSSSRTPTCPSSRTAAIR
jgi:hypothetical protein